MRKTLKFLFVSILNPDVICFDSMEYDKFRWVILVNSNRFLLTVFPLACILVMLPAFTG